MLTKNYESHSRYDASRDTSYETIEAREHTISTHFDYRHRDENETWREDDDVERKIDACSRSIEERESEREENEIRWREWEREKSKK